MRQLARAIAAVLVALLWFGSWGATPVGALSLGDLSAPTVLAVAEGQNPADAKREAIGNKIDINNSNLRQFRKLRGFYPTLARKIILNAPYEEVEDLFEIEGLSQSQRDRIDANLDEFVVTPPAGVYNEGDDRLNNGIYN